MEKRMPCSNFQVVLATSKRAPHIIIVHWHHYTDRDIFFVLAEVGTNVLTVITHSKAPPPAH
eukprot:4263539-Ditylum_brightwellii.AAC.1